MQAASHSPALRLLCVTAHPDDEAGGFGGSIALYASRGVETHVVCLTAGAAARHRGGARNDEELKELRRHEFQASCARLDVFKGEVLDYPDGKLLSADPNQVVGDLAQRIRTIRPQVMLTFGPDGGLTGHPDHAMAGVFASLAFEWAARSDRFPEQLTPTFATYRAQKLYYQSALFTLPDRAPTALPPVTTSIEIGTFFDIKLAAFRKHTTQAPLFERFEGFARQNGTHEHFHLAATSRPMRVQAETDLFAGVIP
jgi:LmbE family N-acetylglucosaminyl deacetylase